MCWLVLKSKNKIIKEEYIDRAALFNKDGFGIARIKDGKLHVSKTLDLNEFKTELAQLDDVECLIHMRAASIGGVSIDNVHPFETSSGVMFHNGTISSFRGKTDKCAITGCEDSDTKALADLIAECTYTKITDIVPLIQHIITKTANKLAFMENDGTVIIMNKHLGQEEDGIWFSNDYHLPTVYTKYDSWNNYDFEKVTKVFVYGTLKQGYSNNYLLNQAVFAGKATSLSPFYMVGKGMSFPYVLGKGYEFPNTKAQAHFIKGEMYTVTDAVLARLDALEGCPSHYKRDTAWFKSSETGVMEECYIYVKTSVTEDDLSKEMLVEWTNGNMQNNTQAILDLSDKIEEYKLAIKALPTYTEEELSTFTMTKLQDIYDDYSILFYGEVDEGYLLPKTKDLMIPAIICLRENIQDEYLSL